MTADEQARALRQFCAELDRLRRDAKVSVDTLLMTPTDPPVGLRRSQIYAVLRGNVATVPAWDFVRVFVRLCASRAALARRPLSVSTDLEYWRREHCRITELPRGAADPPPPLSAESPARVLTVQQTMAYEIPDAPSSPARRIGIVTADIRHVRTADVWVNSENTEMQMARIHECSISAIVRYEGAARDLRGRVVVDSIADELEAQVAGIRPVGPGEVVVTGPGELRHRNGVRFVIHAAAVHGEPGAGFRQIAEVGRCVDNTLAAAEWLEADPLPLTVLFPLLGAGTAGGDVAATARVLMHRAINYLRSVPSTQVGTVLFLAYTDVELDACRMALSEVPDLVPLTLPRPRRGTRNQAVRRSLRPGATGAP